MIPSSVVARLLVLPLLLPMASALGPRHYRAPHVTTPPVIDGRVDDAAWRTIPWSEPFVDIEGDTRPAPRLRTRMKLAWDDSTLFIAGEMEEPHLWATLTTRDAVIFHDNDFEVFIDPDGDASRYFELEINALNTQWDLFLPVAYRDGGKALDAFDFAGLRSAVALDGTLNDPSDRDRGWTIEIAIPFAAFAAPGIAHPAPRAGETWRINFSRVEWDLDATAGHYAKVLDATTGKPTPEHNWVWSPQGMIDMHQPERWGVVEFTRDGGAR
jgi:hypothetical protein